MNLQELNEIQRLAHDERWHAIAGRRAKAMNKHVEQGVGFSSPPPRLPEVGRPIYSPHARPPSPQTDRTDLQRALGILRKHWRISTVFTLVVVGTVTVTTLMMKPMFAPQARVEVDPPGAEVFSLAGNNNSGAATDFMETQAQNLQNDELTLQVIRRLHLDQSPYFGADPSAISGRPKLSTEDAVPLTPAENRALEVFSQSRKITRDAASRLITVSVSAPNPVVAATVTNTLVSMFIERDYTLRNDAISQSSKWLQRQLDDIRQRMDDSNRALNSFETSHGISTIGDNQDRFSDQMAQLSRQLIQAQSDRIQLQSYLSELNGVQSNSLPQVNSNPVVQELTKKLADAKAEMAETRAIYGGSHPNIKKLQNEVDELESQLQVQRAEVIRDLKTSYTAAQTRENLTQSQMQGASRQMTVLAQYNALKKESDANTQLYQALYQKIKEAAIAAETKSSNIRVVDRARVLDRPTSPHRRQDIEIGLLAGILGGVIVAFFMEGLDTRIRTPEDIKRCLGTESISVVPVISDGQPAATDRPVQRLTARNIPEATSLFQIRRPDSPEGEALRNIGVAVRLSPQNTTAPQVILIVSPLMGEGKTTLSVNLGLTLAQHGSTCIVDADLRKGHVARALAVDAYFGITDVLLGTMELEQVLVPGVQLPNLSLLASGSARGEPGELLSSKAMVNLIGKLRQRFEFIVIDSPPMLLVSDSRALSTLADGVILVGRAGVTTRASLKRTMELLAGVRSAPILEVVLNAAEYSAADSQNYGVYGMAGSNVA